MSTEFKVLRWLCLAFALACGTLSAQSRVTSIVMNSGTVPIDMGQVQPGATMTRTLNFTVQVWQQQTSSNTDVGQPLFIDIVRTNASSSNFTFAANGLNVPVSPFGTPLQWPTTNNGGSNTNLGTMDSGPNNLAVKNITLVVTLQAGAIAGRISDTFTLTAQVRGAGGGDVQRKAMISNLGVTGVVANPLTLVQTTPLHFGAIAPSGTAGTVILTPDSAAGTRSIGLPGPSLLPSALAPSASGEFTVGGSGGLGFTITLPVSINLTGPGASMTVDAFTSTPSASSVIGAGGTATFRVGGTLHVGASQAAGDYSGTYAVTCAYQ